MIRGRRTIAWLCTAIAAASAAPGGARASAMDRRAVLDSALAEFDEALAMRADDPAGARSLFRSAAQRFQSLVTDGVVNGRLEYDLGNCFLQSGDIGRAILHYRRAERLAPRDPLLANNLSVARTRCITSVPPSRRSAVLRGVFFWHYQTTFAGRLLAGVGLYVLCWVLLTIYAVRRRRAIGVSAAVCALLVLSIAASLMVDHWSDRNAPPGVVTRMDVPVHTGPGSGYPRRFEQPLQPGTEFDLRERRGDWWRIQLPDGGSGWIAAAAAELVLGNNL